MIFFSFAFLYAYLQVIYGPNSKFLNTYSKYSLYFEGKNIKYQKYWKLCSKSWFYVDIFLSWKITATHIDFSPNLRIENRCLCIKNSKMQGQNKRYLCLSTVHCTIPKSRDLRSDLDLCQKVGSTIRSRSRI